jgi:glycosyltransferase involved in cell wall biosynthesis
MMVRSTPSGSISEVATLDDPYAAYLRDDPDTIHAFGSRRQLTAWLRARRSHFDGIVVHGLWEPMQISVLTAIAGHTPYVVYPHGMLDPYFKRAFPLKHAKKWLFWLTVQNWVLRRARHVVFTANAERDLAAQSFWLHRWNPAVISLGAATPPTDLARYKEAFLQRWPALRDKRFLLFLGRIDPKKGCDLLLDAFTTLDPPDIHLVMVGPAPHAWEEGLRQRLRSSSFADRIHCPGMLTGQAKWGALAAADAFILPSHQENFGIAIVEALACGTPALLTHPINIAADLDGDNSAIVDADTFEGTQRLIFRWLALTPEDRAAMRTNARASVATRYDMRKNTQALFDLFSKMPRGARPA